MAVSNTAIVVKLDVGNPADIHPCNKKTAGERMAKGALTMVNKKSYPLSYATTTYAVMGNEVYVKFKNAKSGLMANKNELLNGYAIGGADTEFVWAQAKPVGKNELVVTGDVALVTVSVRYAWTSSPVNANFVNGQAMLSAPFRNDY